MSDTNWIRNKPPKVGQKILAVIEWDDVSVCTVCHHDTIGQLIDDITDRTTGFCVGDITRWCPLDVALEAIGG